MNLPFELIQNKQRILIGGNHGTHEIFELCRAVLEIVGKEADFYTGNPDELTNAPVVFFQGFDELVNNEPGFNALQIHMLLIHAFDEQPINGYADFEAYVAAYEQLADQLPKAGSLVYNEVDNVSMLIGKKERADVKNIEYTTLKHKIKDSGIKIKSEKHKALLHKTDEQFAAYASASKALLNRIGISDEQFFAALNQL